MAKKTASVPTTGSTAPVPFWDSSDAAYEVLTPVDGWSPWDTATIAGAPVPGVVSVHTRKRRRYVTASGIGANREEMVDTGPEASLVEISCTMWRPEHLQQYAELAKQIQLKGKKSKGELVKVSVVHPGLAMLGIQTLYITGVDIPKRSSPGGPYVGQLEAMEYLPPKKTAKGASAKGQIRPIDKALAAKETDSAIAPRVNGGAPSASVATTKP
jgi:hypothetical protein